MKCCTKLTRRQLAAALAALAAPPESLAQTAPAQNTPADLLQAARDRIKTNSELLAKVEIPMATEPAFQFRA